MYLTGDVTILPSGGSVRVISVTNLILIRFSPFFTFLHLRTFGLPFSSGKINVPIQASNL